jgi:ABC-type antimicrobial peptide transport system ATPase subunit
MLKLSERSDHADMSSNIRSVMSISKYHHCPEKTIKLHLTKSYKFLTNSEAIYRNKQIEKTLHLVGCTLEIYLRCTGI